MNNDILPTKRPEQPQRSEVNLVREQAEKPMIEGVGTTPPKSTPPKKKRSFVKLLIGFVLGLVLIAVLAIGGLAMWYQSQLEAVSPGSKVQEMIVLKEGVGSAGLATTLKQKDLIRNELAFRLYIKLRGADNELQAGAYRISKGADVASIVDDITSGKTDIFAITFLPGATVTDSKKVLKDADYSEEEVNAALKKTYNHPLFATKPETADLEGYIYGETYQFGADASAESVLEYTFDEMYKVIKNNDLVAKYKAKGLTLYEGITLASIIQREAANDEEMAQISQVFHLRLKEGMPLGSDPTYQYIADKTGRERDPAMESPYNTRVVKGLPPGPIASPGQAALLAVAAPASGDYVYFVHGDDDKAHFSHTNAEHEANVQKYCKQKCQIL